MKPLYLKRSQVHPSGYGALLAQRAGSAEGDRGDSRPGDLNAFGLRLLRMASAGITGGIARGISLREQVSFSYSFSISD